MTDKPTLVQCDFDGTVTLGDVSFLILDEFTGSVWRQEFEAYMAGKITVNRFNTQTFARVKASREELDHFVRQKAVVRPGLMELLTACQARGFRFIIVSNGMKFYIETILNMLGLKEVAFIAAEACFSPQGIESWYPGPDGQPVEDGFKEVWTQHFLRQGYRVVYIGNGTSDFPPARLCQHILGVDNLLARCREEKVDCQEFTSLSQAADFVRQLN
jgi:2-hydroxy-3-keto-5-methylthiopentenyl-1-phosphate phosphatase